MHSNNTHITGLLALALVVLADIKMADAKNQQRPAAITSQEKHSTESPKGSMIKKQMKEVDKAADDAEKAKSEVENRPAVTTDYK